MSINQNYQIHLIDSAVGYRNKRVEQLIAYSSAFKRFFERNNNMTIEENPNPNHLRKIKNRKSFQPRLKTNIKTMLFKSLIIHPS